MTDKGTPTGYAASDEYQKEIRKNAGPRNVPPHIMAQMRGAAFSSIAALRPEQAASEAGFNQKVALWNTNGKDKRLEMVTEIDNIEELRAAMIMEEDNDVLELMVSKKRVLEEGIGQ